MAAVVSKVSVEAVAYPKSNGWVKSVRDTGWPSLSVESLVQYVHGKCNFCPFW